MTTVFCHGVWDLLHPGHIAHLEQARSFGDRLVVGVTSDKWVNKGPGRPVFNERQRLAQVSALKVVSKAVLSDAPTCIRLLKTLPIDIYVKGSDYTYETLLPEERKVLESRGIIFKATSTPKLSSTFFFNRMTSPYPASTQEWLQGFAKRYSMDDVIRVLDSIAGLSILVIGEAITDKYIHVETLAKSPREHYMSSRYRSGQVFHGGSIMVSDHLWDFVTDILTIHQRQGITKTRFLDIGHQVKMFGVQEIPEPLLTEGEEADILRQLADVIDRTDIVMVLDYGHGFFTSGIQNKVESNARFLAVNCQTNSANYGHNLITKWKRADYISMDKPEYDLAISNGWDSNTSKHLMVTNGSKGCSLGVDVPALALNVQDRLGAGDAMFALTAPLIALGHDPELVAFIGNCASALQCGTVGNEKAVTRKCLEDFACKLLR